MAEYNIIKVDSGDFNQTDNALGQIIQNHYCGILMMIMFLIFCFTLIQIFKITNKKSVGRDSHKICKKRKGK